MGQKKGYKQTKQHKENISNALKSAYKSGRHKGGFKEKHTLLGFKGKKHTKEWKLEQSERMKENNPMNNESVRLKVSETRINNMIVAGSANPNWKGGRSKYRGADWRKQRLATLKRDKYVCQICGKTQEDLTNELTVHHITPYHNGGNNDLNNLLTVCISCHFSIEPRIKCQMKNS